MDRNPRGLGHCLIALAFAAATLAAFPAWRAAPAPGEGAGPTPTRHTQADLAARACEPQARARTLPPLCLLPPRLVRLGPGPTPPVPAQDGSARASAPAPDGDSPDGAPTDSTTTPAPRAVAAAAPGGRLPPPAVAADEARSWTDRISEIDNHAYLPGELLLKVRPEATPEERSRLVGDLLGASVQAGLDSTGDWLQIRLPGSLPVAEALERLRAEPSVEYAEPDYVVHAVKSPNEPNFPALWGLHNAGQAGGHAGADIHAPEAWDVATGGDVIVAVIDSGVDYRHPDLASNMWRNEKELHGRRGVDDDGNGLADDVYGYDFANEDPDPLDDNKHGTHVSGTIAASGNNGLGVVGVCWKARIMALKFMSGRGEGSTAAAIKAINYARRNGARVMSNSWGGGPYSRAVKDAIDAAAKAGILFVVAAGNEHNNNDVSPSYPASYSSSNIISVAATDPGDALASFSNYGVRSVDLGAPGTDIYSTLPSGRYGYLSGTSMACPHVAGAAALLWSANPNATLAEVKNALLTTVDPVPGLAHRVSTGGRLNVGRAIRLIKPDRQ